MDAVGLGLTAVELNAGLGVAGYREVWAGWWHTVMHLHREVKRASDGRDHVRMRLLLEQAWPDVEAAFKQVLDGVRSLDCSEPVTLLLQGRACSDVRACVAAACARARV